MGEQGHEADGVEWIDLGRHSTASADHGTGARPSRAGAGQARPNWLLAAGGVAVFLALLAAYGLGRATDPAPQVQAAPQLPTPVALPTPTLIPTPAAPPVPTPQIEELLGEGDVLAELALADGSSAVIWCRETVPGTRIAPTLALLHIQETARFGDQLVAYEELTTPWVPTGASWRGQLDTEGFGADTGEPVTLDGTEIEGTPGDGTRCATCAPERADLDGVGPVLVGNCEHGVPFRAGISYVVASPSGPGQTPLALHLSCGITSVQFEGERLRVDAEVPLVRGLTDARFRLPSVRLDARDGRFWADDLGLLDWACDVERSSQLGDRHLLRTDAEPRLTYNVVDSALGPIGVHGPLIVGIVREQCSQLTRAWWDRPSAEREEDGRPVADLVGIEPPAGEADWVYTCQPE